MNKLSIIIFNIIKETNILYIIELLNQIFFKFIKLNLMKLFKS